MDIGWQDLCRNGYFEIEAVRNDLPERYASGSELLITFERRPIRDVRMFQVEGIEGDKIGIFTGLRTC